MGFPMVDVHAHMMPTFYADALRARGYANPDGMPGLPGWSVEDHLAFMNKENIRKAYLSISSPGTFLPTAVHKPPSESDLTAARALTRQCNAYGAQLKRQYRLRFGYFASLLLPSVPDSLDEIEHCVKELDVDGFVLHTNSHGLYLGDSRLDPVWESLNQHDAVVFLHPTSPCTPASSRFCPDAGQQRNDTAYHAHLEASNNDRDDDQDAAARYQGQLRENVPLIDSYATPLLEFLFDTTRAVTDLLMCGAATRFPKIRWIVPHCGATLPSMLDRIIEFGPYLTRKETTTTTASLPSLTRESAKYLFNNKFWFDLAGTPMQSQIHHMLRLVDHTRFMYGSDVPFTSWDVAAALADKVRSHLQEIFGGETGVHEIMRISHGNAEDLFNS